MLKIQRDKEIVDFQCLVLQVNIFILVVILEVNVI